MTLSLIRNPSHSPVRTTVMTAVVTAGAPRTVGSYLETTPGASWQLFSILITKLISLYPHHWRRQRVFFVAGVFHIGNFTIITAEGSAMRQPGIVRRRDSGQSLVEFALILPLLIAFIFGIIELGILFSVYVGMTNSAREAARAGSVYQYTGDVPQTGDPTIKATIDGQRQQYISQIITDTINPLIDPVTQLKVTFSYTQTTGLPENIYRAGDTIAVQLDHDQPLFFGLLGPKKIHMRAISSMRIEPGGKQ